MFKSSEKLSNKEAKKNMRKRYSVFSIIIAVLLILIIAFVVEFNGKQNSIINNNSIIYNESAENIVGRKAIITEFFGNVVINRDRIDVEVFEGFRLEEGDIIKTGVDSFAKIDIDDDKQLNMDANSIIEISTMTGNDEDNITTIVLSNGRVMNYINEKLNSNSRYEVKTLNTVIGVKGTIFAVTCESNSENNYFTKVENLSGLVEVEKVNIQNINEVLDKVILNENKYTVVEEKVSNQEKLQIKQIDEDTLDDFIKKDLDEMIMQRNNNQNEEKIQNNENNQNEEKIQNNENNQNEEKIQNNENSQNEEKIQNNDSNQNEEAGQNIENNQNNDNSQNEETGQNNDSNQNEEAGQNNDSNQNEEAGQNIENNQNNDNSQNEETGQNSDNSRNNSNLLEETGALKDLEKPTLIISGPNVYSVKVGEEIKFVAQYFDNVGIRDVVLTPGDIVLHGFKADINITYSGRNSRIILLSNVQGDLYTDKYIEILAGTSIDTNGNVSSNARSAPFRIEEQNNLRLDKNSVKGIYGNN